MAMARTYTSAGAFRKALEERLKSESRARQMDVNRLRRQVSFDRLLARLFRTEAVPWVLKGGYALELRFKAARSTIDINLTLQRVVGALDNDSAALLAVREMLQAAAAVSLDDWFEYTIGPPISDLNAAPYGGARYSIETRMDGRIFAKFHLDAGIGDVVNTTSRNYRVFRLAELCWNTAAEGARDLMRAAIRRKDSCVHASAKLYE